MKRLDWNEERYKTRDRLLDYTLNNYPIFPESNEIPRIYPWENINLGILSRQILDIAKQYGYTGDEQLLWNRFTNGSIINGSLNTFPIPGEENNLYLDTETGILYYFKIVNDSDINVLEQNSAVIVKEEQNQLYLYIPITALPLDNAFFSNGG